MFEEGDQVLVKLGNKVRRGKVIGRWGQGYRWVTLEGSNRHISMSVSVDALRLVRAEDDKKANEPTPA